MTRLSLLFAYVLLFAAVSAYKGRYGRSVRYPPYPFGPYGGYFGGVYYPEYPFGDFHPGHYYPGYPHNPTHYAKLPNRKLLTNMYEEKLNSVKPEQSHYQPGNEDKRNFMSTPYECEWIGNQQVC
ncbi:hypothetical protein L596_017683 [Steinernema carpocapsae]|uniref:Uncharacterized protein n=1 Tax=Steinernema carpocapsae TaxID=34508 RepID=A0A4U5N2T8_STECR|nr:hypothetical protein L596_017683 [Steinernema carpocapsae]